MTELMEYLLKVGRDVRQYIRRHSNFDPDTDDEPDLPALETILYWQDDLHTVALDAFNTELDAMEQETVVSHKTAVTVMECLLAQYMACHMPPMRLEVSLIFCVCCSYVIVVILITSVCGGG